MSGNFGGSGYTTPQQRALTSIAQSPTADISSQEKLVSLLQEHSAQIKYLATNQKQLQQGVNDATANPIKQIQQFVADIVVLLGGGEIADGLLDFGNLQYILPTLGALFGLGDAPFPIDLFQAAQKFFFGYVVPNEQFVDVINYIIGNWASVFGIDPQFVQDVQALITAISELFGGIGNLLPSLNGLFEELGLEGRDLGPLGTVLKPIIKLFSGIDLANFGDAIEFITDAIDPFIVKLTAVINFINGVLAVVGHDGDVVNSPLPEMLTPIRNLVGRITAAFDHFGLIRQAVLPPIHIGRLTNSLPSLAFDSDFDIDPDGDDTAGTWYFDVTVGHTEVGSAAIGADGDYHDLPSERVAVAEKQRYRPSVFVAWESATGTAGSVQLQVLEFLDDTLINTVVLATTTPSGTADFTEIFGTYTVPDGVDQVALTVAVTAGFTAGTVWADDLTGEPVGLLDMAWTDKLVERWQNTASLFGIEDTDLDGDIDLRDIWAAVFGDFLDFEGAGVLNGALDGIDLEPRALLDKINQRISDALEDRAVDGEFITRVTGLMGDFDGLERRFTNLRDTLKLDIDELNDHIDDFDPLQAIDRLIEDRLKPLQKLADIAAMLDGIQGLDFDDVPADGRVAALIAALRAIPSVNISGVGGPSDIGATMQQTWNQWVGGLVGEVGAGAGLADVFNIGQDISSRATLGQLGWGILGIRNNKSFSTGMLSSSTSSVPLTQVAAGSTAPTFALTQSTAITLYERVGESALLGVVRWMGSGVTDITHFFVNIWKMDPLTGDRELVHGSANIIGDVGSSMTTNKYVVPMTIQREPGEVFGYELSLRGTGTHLVVGNETWLHDDPDVYPRRMSSERDSGTSAPPSTIDSGDTTYSSNIPFIEAGVGLDDVVIPHVPLLVPFDTAGSSTFPVPSWANFVQVPVLGAGGGGRKGGTWGVGGEGGEAGDWDYVEWVRGVDFTDTPVLDITVGAGGAPGGSVEAGGAIGGNGGTTTVELPATTGFPGDSVSAAGGEGGDALTVGGVYSEKQGKSPGDQTHDGVVYNGGAAQDVFGADGAPAGGGGAGGNWVSLQNGGRGAPGFAGLRFKQ